jgi:hypothetical protein
LTLLALSGLIVVIELFRAGGPYSKILLAATILLLGIAIQHLSTKLFQSTRRYQSSQNGSM